MTKKKIPSYIPDTALPVREAGKWTIYVSKPERSFYIQPSDGSIDPLKLSLDEILQLVKSMVALPSATSGSGETGRELSADGHRRRFKRYTRRCEAEFTAGDITGRGIASDFSFSGLFLKTNHPVPPDTLISITVHLPGGTTSHLRGTVKRSMKTAIGRVMGLPVKSLKNGMGLELTEKDTPYLDFIRSLLHQE
jgi:hypothetical protein